MCPDSAVINHPVHIITKDIQLSPSAFIPFCDFGGEMSTVGVKTDQFDVPVCNAFEAKIMNDQLCYEVDLKSFSDKHNIINELKLGLNFIMDYNIDRQIAFNEKQKRTRNISLATVESDHIQQAIIYLNTIGEYEFYCSFMWFMKVYHANFPSRTSKDDWWW